MPRLIRSESWWSSSSTTTDATPGTADTVSWASETISEAEFGAQNEVGSRPLGRLERLERDEIVRCLTRPGPTVTRAAEELGIGRATPYRKIAQYGITLPG